MSIYVIQHLSSTAIKKIRLTIDTQKDFKKVSTFLNRMKDKKNYLITT